MPPIETGIDNITKVTNIVVDIFNQGVELYGAGKKFTAVTLLSFIDEAAALAAASGSWKEIPSEVKNLSQDETNTIIKNVETRLNIPNPNAKVIVADSLALLACGSKLFFSIKAAKEAKKPPVV